MSTFPTPTTGGPLASPQARPGQVITQLPRFDYLPSLNNEESAQLYQITQTIRRNVQISLASIIEAGKELRNVKKLLPHGDFGTWLSNEFEMSERTAQHMMGVAERLGDRQLSDLPINVSALYELAAPSTPDAVIDEVIERAQSGEQITRADVRSARGQTLPHERTFTIPSGISVRIIETVVPGVFNAWLFVPDGPQFHLARSAHSRLDAVQNVISQYHMWADKQTVLSDSEPVFEVDDLPAEPIADLIFAALDDGVPKSLKEIRAIVKKTDPDISAFDLGSAVGNMVSEGDLLKHPASPGGMVTYSLNGHTENGGQHAPTVDDDREAILTMLDNRPRDIFYKNQISRWSGINDLKRTTTALLALTDVLRPDEDAYGKELFRRVNPINQPEFTDAGIPTVDEVYDLVVGAGGSMEMSDIIDQFSLTFSDLGVLIKALNADDRVKVGEKLIYTSAHPHFHESFVDPLAHPNQPAPVINGQEALRADIQQMRAQQAMPALSKFAELLGNIEAALSVVRTADLADLRLADDDQRQKLAQRINQHRDQLHTFHAYLDRLAASVAPATDHADEMSFAEALDSADREAQSNVGDSAAWNKAITASESIPTIDIPETRPSLPEHVS